MVKQTITYLGLEDNKPKTRDFYFNLTKGEVVKLNLALPGGIEGFMKHLDDDPTVEDVVAVFEKIILMSYGKRTADNKFVKSQTLREEFAASDAYSELFIKFIENEDDFVNKFLTGAMNISEEDMQKLLAASEEPTTELATLDDL